MPTLGNALERYLVEDESKPTRRAGDPAVLIASSGRIMRELGWKPMQQKLDAIVESAWRWMQRRR
jgi:UDP-glucose 4-epimerase